MGKTDTLNLIPFTHSNILDKDLVIKMLKFEEEFTKSDEGQSLYKNFLNKPLISLNVEKTINRIVLTRFGFDTSDESVENYRTIFKTYYKSPNDYDKDVLDAVHYMRENKVVYYKKPLINIGDQIPNCRLYELDGKTITTLYDNINKLDNYTIIAGFSLS